MIGLRKMPKRARTSHEEDEDADRVIAEYDVFLTKSSIPRFLIQYPDRKAAFPYNSQLEQKPQELRVKPVTGLVEVDIPIDTTINYDGQKGARYSQAMKKSRLVKGGGSYGISGGFSEGPISVPVLKLEDGTAVGGRRSTVELDTDEDGTLAVQTLGGRIVPSKGGDPIYALGAFQDGGLHLSKLDGSAQLRPQLHHVDAIHDERRQGRAQIATEDPTRPAPQARAVEMRVTSADGEEMNMKGKDDLLREIQTERWSKYEFRDDNDTISEAAYSRHMFKSYPSNAENLTSTMKNDEYLDAISAPRYDPTKPEKKEMRMRIRSRDSETEPGETTEAAEESDVLEIVEEKKVEPKMKEKAKRQPRTKKPPKVGKQTDGPGSEAEVVKA